MPPDLLDEPECGRRLVVPGYAPVVETTFDRRFDDLELWRDVEVARRVEAVVADVQDLLAGVLAGAGCVTRSVDHVWHSLKDTFTMNLYVKKMYCKFRFGAELPWQRAAGPTAQWMRIGFGRRRGEYLSSAQSATGSLSYRNEGCCQRGDSRVGGVEVAMQIVEAVRQWWRVQSFLSKLEALGPAVMAEVARDNAVAEADLRRLASRKGADSSLLRRLLERLGADFDHLARSQASVGRDMAVVCAGCTMTRRCRSDLALQGAPMRHGRYCPNMATIKALRQDPRAISRQRGS